MLADRLRSSAVLILITSALLLADAKASAPGGEGLFLVPLLLFFALGTVWDMVGLLHGAGFPIHRRTTVLAVMMIVLAPCIVPAWNATASWMPSIIAAYPTNCPIGRMGWIVIAAVAVTALFFLVEMKDYSSATDASLVLRRLSGGVFACMYVALPMSLLVILRSLGSEVPSGENWGLAALLTMIATTKSTDAGAYFTGKSLGKHRLIPRLSPGKTIEGAIGGIVVATAVAAVCLAYLFPAMGGSENRPPVMLAFILGPALAISGMIGDLAQSLVKRTCGAKDSGNWLPGLGGVWDVTDSLIFAVLPAFLCFLAAA